MPWSSFASPEQLQRYSRTIEAIGPAGFAELRRARVAIVGLGGVGSHAACALVRSGVGGVRLVDFDLVTWSSLNRHAAAVAEDVGRPKAEVLEEHLLRIGGDVSTETRRVFCHSETVEEILSPRVDFVVDAIDSEGPKVALLRYCFERGVPVVSSMGAGARTDPTQVQVADIARTSICPLARNVRKRLRRLGIAQGIQAVYSTESPGPSLPPDDSEDFLGRGRRRRVLPSLATVPAVFGLTAAGVVIRAVADRANRAPDAQAEASKADEDTGTSPGDSSLLSGGSNRGPA